MTKGVRLGPTAYGWVQRHFFLSEDVIISIVTQTPKNLRKYIDDSHFQIEFKRTKNGKVINVTIWVHDRETEFYVGKLHSQRI